jgi:hypothetical protein
MTIVIIFSISQLSLLGRTDSQLRFFPLMAVHQIPLDNYSATLLRQTARNGGKMP